MELGCALNTMSPAEHGRTPGSELDLSMSGPAEAAITMLIHMAAAVVVGNIFAA